MSDRIIEERELVRNERGISKKARRQRVNREGMEDDNGESGRNVLLERKKREKEENRDK